MKNSLSHIYHELNAVFELQPQQGSGRWSKGIEIVERKEPGADTPMWWLAESAAERLLTPEQLDELAEADCLENRGMAKAVRLGSTSKRAFCINIGKLRHCIRQAESKAAKSAGADKRIRELQAELKVAREYNALDQAYARLLEEVRGHVKLKPYKPRELIFKRPSGRGRSQRCDGVPTLFLSDWHFGEVVSLAETDLVNEYNVEIATSRIKRIFNGALETLFPAGVDKNYDGIVIALGGDMLSGIIHEELRETNEMAITRCIPLLAGLLCDHICQFAQEFQMVYVPAVCGNHGRIDRNPKAKRASLDNWEHLLYTMTAMLVQKTLGDNCNVTFTISEGRELCFRIYNTTYLLTHGDEGLKGGRDQGEFWGNLLRSAQHKWRKTESQFGGFDYLMCGHFHRYGAVGNVICNGSLKGFDELGVKESYHVEDPVQALWLTYPVGGINGHVRLEAQAEEGIDELLNAAPITLPKCQPALSIQ